MDPLAPFHPAVRSWFASRLGAPSAPQRDGWPLIGEGRHVLIAAPTGTGKTLAAFLWAIDRCFRQGDALADETQVVYVSPLRALSNDVQKNLQGPLAEIRALDPALPEVRVLVRTGDTPQKERAKVARRPPHLLVTTPESLYLLLTSRSGRGVLRTVRTVIVDEVHAIARDKRGSHLALSLERLEALCESQGHGAPQRIGLSATVRPVESVASLLGGVGREVARVDTGHLRALDLAVVVPDTPLTAVCSHEQWGELHRKMADLVRAHRTTLAFVGTRKLAERLAARLSDELGPQAVGCHHGSLSKEIRLEAEQRLKAGELRVLVATASLELGIDIGDVDLVLQIGSPRSIATLLQRVGRSGHGQDRVPKGRLFPLTLDEAVEACALLRAVAAGALDRTPEPPLALDILAQQIVAACVGEDWREEDLYARLARAWPYRDVTREDFEQVVRLHAKGRNALLHRDQVGGRVMATKRAAIPAWTSGGAIPDNADYRVVLEPEGTFIGTLNEDFAVESNAGDVFQLGNAQWRILKVERGTVRVADAAGEAPTLPFWLGEAPSRTRELSHSIGDVREQFAAAMGDLDEARRAEWIERECRVAREVAEQVAEYLAAGLAALGAMPSHRRVVLERFSDESGGTQLVVHSLHGSRTNRAFGLALRKRFCRGFGFELQAAADEEAIVLSLSPRHGFELADVFGYVRSAGARELLVQALLAAPMFATRWRWNASRALLLPRVQGGKPVAPQIQRMRADDLLAEAFPEVMACGETLPPGDLPVPDDHPIVRQTVEDCLREAMDVDAFLELLRDLESGSIERHAIDTAEPSPFARGILSARPYAFLDDAPLEERRTQAVRTRGVVRPMPNEDPDDLGRLDPAAIARVRAEAWPSPEGAEEVHEALLWMGFATEREVEPWRAWIDELARAGRVVRAIEHEGERIGERWFAAEASREGRDVLRGRLEALGPVDAADPLLAEFAAELEVLAAGGEVLRARFEGRMGWCNRRLLARIRRYTIDDLRERASPVSAAAFLRFLAAWQHAAPGHRLHGPRGVLEVVRQLSGFQAPAASWERHLIKLRVEGYREEWLDQIALSGEVAWGRLWGSGAVAIRAAPIAIVPREELDLWLALRGPAEAPTLDGDARTVHERLASAGPSFAGEIARACGLLPSQAERGLAELVALGLATCDSFAGLRALFHRPHGARRPLGRDGRRRERSAAPAPIGRWSLLRAGAGEPASQAIETAARALLRRTGVVFRRTVLNERIPVAWRDVLRVCRRLEARGEVHGGRFVAGFAGEQYALPEAVALLRRLGREEPAPADVAVAASDPLNFSGILTPDARVPVNTRGTVSIAAS